MNVPSMMNHVGQASTPAAGLQTRLFPIEATAAQLMDESSKARENGERYALLTAQNAVAAERWVRI